MQQVVGRRPATDFGAAAAEAEDGLLLRPDDVVRRRASANQWETVAADLQVGRTHIIKQSWKL